MPQITFFQAVNVFIFACVLLDGTSNIHATITVHTNVGTIIGMNTTLTRLVDGKAIAYSKFLGIPFAESTAGKNRFNKPVSKAPFSTAFEATNGAIACIQSSSNWEHLLTKYANFTEDCLILNIYVPHTFTEANMKVPLPVMIWIHGGSFQSGTSAIFLADGICSFGNIIVVTINYRLGMFGFLHSADGSMVGNQGLWDQHLAIKWVHDNIAAFTGSPDHVTIFGESAGSASVLFQSLYAGNAGLFQRVIAQSGSALASWATMEHSNAEAFIKYKGCDKGHESASACLRSMSPPELQYDKVGFKDTIFFRPIVDNDFLVAKPRDIVYGHDGKAVAATEFFASLDIIVGVNNYDGAMYVTGVWPSLLGYTYSDNFTMTQRQFSDVAVPVIASSATPHDDRRTQRLLKTLLSFQYMDWTEPYTAASLRMSLVHMSSDSAFFYPALSTVRAHATFAKARTYFYEFCVNPTHHSLVTPTWISGANHADEIQYIFGYPLFANEYAYTIKYTEEEKRVAREMIHMWTNFARTGHTDVFPKHAYNAKPGNDSLVWPEYDNVTQAYLDISNDVTSVQTRFTAQRMEFWSQVIPSVVPSEKDGECVTSGGLSLPRDPSSLFYSALCFCVGVVITFI